jgi:hypothetical protein
MRAHPLHPLLRIRCIRALAASGCARIRCIRCCGSVETELKHVHNTN